MTFADRIENLQSRIENACLKSARAPRTARQDIDAPKNLLRDHPEDDSCRDAPQPCAGNDGVSRRAAAAAHRSSMHFDGSDALSASKGQGRPPFNRADDARRRRARYAQDTQVCFIKIAQKDTCLGFLLVFLAYLLHDRV